MNQTFSYSASYNEILVKFLFQRSFDAVPLNLQLHGSIGKTLTHCALNLMRGMMNEYANSKHLCFIYYSPAFETNGFGD